MLVVYIAVANNLFAWLCRCDNYAHGAALRGLNGMTHEDTFKAMKPAEKKRFFDELFTKANTARRESEFARRGSTQGSAFLWVSLYGKDSISRAFRSYLKKHHKARIFQNYRGSKYAWYFGSQRDLGVYDGLMSMCQLLSQSGIPALLCDEWD